MSRGESYSASLTRREERGKDTALQLVIDSPLLLPSRSNKPSTISALSLDDSKVSRQYSSHKAAPGGTVLSIVIYSHLHCIALHYVVYPFFCYGRGKRNGERGLGKVD